MARKTKVKELEIPAFLKRKPMTKKQRAASAAVTEQLRASGGLKKGTGRTQAELRSSMNDINAKWAEQTREEQCRKTSEQVRALFKLLYSRSAINRMTIDEAAATIKAGTVAPALNQPLHLLQRKRKNEMTEKKAAAKKKAPAAKKAAIKKVGVIDEITKLMERKTGATVNEMVDVLATKFPDRDPAGMKATCRIQVSRIPKKTGRAVTKTKTDKRGLVYTLAAAA